MHDLPASPISRALDDSAFFFVVEYVVPFYVFFRDPTLSSDTSEIPRLDGWNETQRLRYRFRVRESLTFTVALIVALVLAVGSVIGLHAARVAVQLLELLLP